MVEGEREASTSLTTMIALVYEIELQINEWHDHEGIIQLEPIKGDDRCFRHYA